jgi:beta-lactamase superfamily II metal-dependent hydrolase
MSELLVKIWDVKHGHATYIRTPNGRHIVVDLGTGTFSGSNDIFSPLLYLKHYYKVNKIDYCIITHPHMDHIDDIMNLMVLSPKILLRPKHIPDDILLKGVRDFELPKIKEYLRIHHKYNRPIESNDYNYPGNPNNWGGLKISTFHPKNCSISNLNNQSIVTVFEYATTKIVIPGDNESASWNELLKNDEFVQKIKNADIYLASHHGRESGYHEEVINIINPSLTVVSDASFHENSNIERYRRKSRGWMVYHGDLKKSRKTLSTYNDGVITIKAGYNPDNKPFLQVNV